MPRLRIKGSLLPFLHWRQSALPPLWSILKFYECGEHQLPTLHNLSIKKKVACLPIPAIISDSVLCGCKGQFKNSFPGNHNYLKIELIFPMSSFFQALLIQEAIKCFSGPSNFLQLIWFFQSPLKFKFRGSLIKVAFSGPIGYFTEISMWHHGLWCLRNMSQSHELVQLYLHRTVS